MQPDQPDAARQEWRLSPLFALGTIVGTAVGILVGWVRYGAFEPGHFSSHVLGGALILGLAFLGLAALRNWLLRNPL